jgi:hypothetical protein
LASNIFFGLLFIGNFFVVVGVFVVSLSLSLSQYRRGAQVYIQVWRMGREGSFNVRVNVGVPNPMDAKMRHGFILCMPLGLSRVIRHF